jgi:hypothetical protein
VLAGDDGFRDGAHADGVGAEAGEGADFRRRFVARSADGEINAALQFHFAVALAALTNSPLSLAS